MSERFKKLCAFLAGILLLPVLLFTLRVPADAAGAQVANVVLFVRYADDSSTVFADNWTAIRNMYEKTDGAETASLKRYISVISDGNLSVTNIFPQENGGALSVLTLPASVTRGDSDYALLNESINAFAAIDGAGTLDNRESGVLDNLTVLVQGSDSGNSSVYPHKGVYAGNNRINGKLVRSYNIINSDALLDSILRQGVICHEFLHSLGLPDLYRYSQSDSGQPVGVWDIMASTSLFMQYPLTYSRSTMGWLTLGEITGSGTYTLDWAGASGGTRGYILRTPLSASEFFVVEYRRAFSQSDGALIQSPPVDFKIPGTGLLIYRVNPQVEGQTNAAGKNYLYVFRPDTTDRDSAAADVRRAAVAAGGSYGSGDFSADYTHNTLYYSDGRNSGLTISDVQLVNGDAQLQFTLSYPDYTSLDLWEDVGGTVSGAESSVSVAVDGGGSVYAACEEGDFSSAVVRRYDGSAWQPVGNSFAGMREPQLLYSGASLYLLGVVGGDVECWRLADGGWTRDYRSALNNQDITYARFVSAGSGVYASFHIGNELYLANIAENRLQHQGTLPDVSWLQKPAVCLYNGSFYAAYMDFATVTDLAVSDSPLSNPAYIARLGESGWEKVQYLGNSFIQFSFAPAASTLHLVISGNFITPRYFSSADGTSWAARDITALSCADVGIVLVNGAPYIGGVTGGSAKVFKLSDGSQLGSDAAVSVDSLALAAQGGKVYAATGSSGGVNVRTKSVETPALPTPTPVPPDPQATPTPSPTPSPTPTPATDPTPTPTPSPTPTSGTDPTTPPTANYTVTVTPPAGYTDTKLWIDGVAYEAGSGATRSAALTNGGAISATMYAYNAGGVPVGMSVWALRYANGAYTATPLPGLENLLSYHGFSIRVEGVSGIRFKTGISAVMRDQLLSGGGVSGYRLAEYGTLFTNNTNLASLPFVKNGDRIGSGRAFWTENGVTNDLIFETVQGRHRFTSVITNVPAAYYKTNFAFRGYIVLEKDGAPMTLYGPVVNRSIYTVAQQVLAAGEFSPGSAGDRYVRNIISSAG